MVQDGKLDRHPLHSHCGAISVGIIDGTPMLDLPYIEDSRAEVDMNVVMTQPHVGTDPLFVEVQGTAEGAPFSRSDLDALIGLAEGGLREIFALQAEFISVPPSRRGVIRLVCASANPDKVAEIESLLDGVVDLAPRPAGVPDVDEYLDTLTGNAWLKADAICRATGLPAVADDTGLFVNALGGLPGVRTACYAGETATYADNRAKLLRELRPYTDRSAEFRTVALVCFPDRRPLAVEGIVRGRISTEERGAGGFGYDPLFVPDEGDGRTFAELPIATKEAVGHRGRAFRLLAAVLM